MKNKSLGVLITSIKHSVHLYPLFRAAKRKKIALAVHLQGDGVRLCLEKRCQEVLDQVQFSICRNSADSLGVTDQIENRYPHALTSSTTCPVIIAACSKQVVL